MKTLKFNQFLSETLVMESITSKPYFKVSLDCPTGGGKSYYILNYLKENAIPFTFIAPTTFLADQLGKAYSIPVYHAATSKEFDHSTNQVITVQNHIGRFIGDSILIIDEAHTFVSDYGYRSSTIEANLTYGTLFRKVILLSGTPLLSSDEFYQGFEKVKAIKTNAIAKTLNLVPYTDWLKATVTLVMESKAKGLTPVVSMLDKSEGLSNLMMALAKEGLTDIATINSVSKDGEQTIESTHYDDLINGREIKADAIITTYTDGYSMYGTNYSLIIVPSKNRHSYLSIVQMMARFRDMDTFDAYLISNVKSSGSMVLTSNYEQYLDLVVSEFTNKANQAILDIRKEARTFRAIDLAFRLTPERFSYLSTDLRVNHQKIAYDATTRITNECYANFPIFQTIMNHFNINLTNTMKAIEGTIKKASVEELTIDLTETIEAFIEEVIVDGRKLEGKEDYDLMREWNSLVDLGLDQPTITKFLIANYGKPKQEYNKLKLEARMKFSSHPTMVKLRKLTYTSFKVGQSFNSNQILEKVLAIFIEAGKDEETTKADATKYLNCMFETIEKKVREGKETVRYYTIKSVK